MLQDSYQQQLNIGRANMLRSDTLTFIDQSFELKL